MVYIIDEVLFNAIPRLRSRFRSVLDLNRSNHSSDALVEDLGPNGWVYEEGTYRGLEVGTKVVCTNSFNIGHVGSVLAIHKNGDVTYNFPTMRVSLKTYKPWESKSKWRLTVVPQETALLTRMTDVQAKRLYELNEESAKKESTEAKKKEFHNMRMYEAFFPPGEWKRRKAMQIRCAKEDDRRQTEDARRLIEDKIGGDDQTLLAWKFKREEENFLRVLENGRRKTEQKQIDESNKRAVHRFARKELLLYHLNDISCLADLIFDIEETIKFWSSPLGWVFEEGEYKGLRPGSRVVCTERFIGHVGYVSGIENDITGLVKYYFPTYHEGKFEEVYSATQAIKSWGLCIVPDDTDLSKIMPPETATSFLRITN